MSSPFAVLRRNQKILLAVFGVIIMLVFVVGSAVQDYFQSNSPDRSDLTLVRWKYGSIGQFDLEAMNHRNLVLAQFLNNVLKRTQERKGVPKVSPIGRANSEEDLVRRMLLARKAQEMGIVVSDDAIFHYLTQLSDSKLSSRDFSEIIAEIPNRRIGEPQILEELRQQLAADNVARMLIGRGLYTLSPNIAWNLFNRVNHRVRAEVLPLNVDDYKTEVREPTDAEIKKFYEDHKEAFSHPDFPEPGFRQRTRRAFEYVKVDFNKFLDAEKAKLTDDELKAEYEKRVARGDFKVPELPAVPAPNKPKATEPEGEQPEDEKPEDSKPGDSKPEAPADKPAAPAESKPDAKPEEDKPAGDKPADEKPATEKPAEKPAEEKPAEKPGACQETPAAEKPAEAKPATEKPAEAKPAEEKPSSEKPAEEKPASEKPATEKPASEKPANDKPAEEKTDAEKPADAKPEDKPADEAPAKPKIKPFEEVREDIALSLARPRAQAASDKAKTAARKELEKASRDLRLANITKNGKFKDDPSTAELNTKFDAKPIAEKYELEYGKTPLVDGLDVLDYELGKGSSFSISNGLRPIRFNEIAYSDRITAYSIEEIGGEDFNVTFLYWLTEEKESRIPSLDEIRTQVIDVWKRRQAVDKAKADAESKAKEARGKESLKEVFGDKVLETNEFSWMTSGSAGFGMGMPSISRVENVDTPGQAFMEAVFALKVGETGVAMNHPETKVYVVRIANEALSEEVRRTRFIMFGMSQDVASLAQLEAERTILDWFSDLEKEMKVEWMKRPATSDE